MPRKSPFAMDLSAVIAGISNPSSVAARRAAHLRWVRIVLAAADGEENPHIAERRLFGNEPGAEHPRGGTGALRP